MSSAEASTRQKTYGLNLLPETPRPSFLIIFINQFTSPFVYLLLVAALISFIFKDYIDCYVILLALLINAAIGTYQEIKADRILDDIKDLAAPKAKVRRDGHVKIIPAKDLVVGDVIILDSGTRIPADARIIQAFLLEVNESTFSGESIPIAKNSEDYNPKLPPRDQKNFVYLGTTISRGRGEAIVLSIGKETKTGQLTETIEKTKKPTNPLHKQIAHFSRLILYLVVSVSVIIFIIGIFQGEARAAFITAVTLAVAAIPEGLPALITITLALGIYQMAQEKALVQNTAAINTLGQITTLITDKTGTLTYNKFQVQKVILPSSTHFNTYELKDLSPFQIGLKDLLESAALANDASLIQANQFDDPLEVSILNFAKDFHENVKEAISKHPRVFELPFEAEYRYMASFNRLTSTKTKILVKGAPEMIMTLCSKINRPHEQAGIDRNAEKDFLKTIEVSHEAGEKVIALASFTIDTKEIQKTKWQPLRLRRLIDKNLTLLGALSLSDGVRLEAKKSINALDEAGIHLVIATGDNSLVAHNVAEKVGIKGEVADLSIENGSERRLSQLARSKQIFARIVPEAKLRLVKVFQDRQEIVAMTGDGVNDAPALKQADVAIAMGKTGTDLAKEASDLVLLDDDISTITQAVNSGRVIVANIQKIVSYLVATNLSEVIVVFVGVIIWGLAARPILPTQILWINLMTDGIAVLPLALEPGHHQVMKNKPRQPNSPLLTNSNWLIIVIIASSIAAISIFIFSIVYSTTNNLNLAQTYTFTFLVFSQLFNLFNCRSLTQSVFSRNLKPNKYILVAFIIGVLFQMVILVMPLFRQFFHLEFLDIVQILLLLALSSIVLWTGEMKKWLYRFN